MEYLPKGFTLSIPPNAFPLSTDSMALADFVRLPRNARVLDLGSGCGTLGLLLCAGNDYCQVTGVELNPDAHEAALENIVRNNLTHRLFSICADLRSISAHFPAGHFSCCVSNPPYFTGGPSSQKYPTARRTDFCSLSELFAAASYALQYGGDFYLVHKPAQLAEICACAAAVNLEPKRLRLIRHTPEDDIALIMLQCRKGGKPGLLWEELTLKTKEGPPTEDYNRIYHRLP